MVLFIMIILGNTTRPLPTHTVLSTHFHSSHLYNLRTKNVSLCFWLNLYSSSSIIMEARVPRKWTNSSIWCRQEEKAGEGCEELHEIFPIPHFSNKERETQTGSRLLVWCSIWFLLLIAFFLLQMTSWLRPTAITRTYKVLEKVWRRHNIILFNKKHTIDRFLRIPKQPS